MAGTIRLSVKIGAQTEEVQFLVAEKLAKVIILGCDYCDQHLESIKPLRRIIEIDDGSTTPIVRYASRSQVEALLSEEHMDKERKKSTWPKIKVNKFTRLPPESQTFVTVTTRREGVIMVGPQQPVSYTHLTLPTILLV